MVRALRLQGIRVKHNCFEEAYISSDCHAKCKACGPNSAFGSSYQGTFTSVIRITADCRLTSNPVLLSKFQAYQRAIWDFQLSFLLEQCSAWQVYIRPLYVRLCGFVSKVQPVLAKHIKNSWSPVLGQTDSKVEDGCFYLFICKLGKNLRQSAPWDNEILKRWIFTEIVFVCSFQLFCFTGFRMELDDTFHCLTLSDRNYLFLNEK